MKMKVHVRASSHTKRRSATTAQVNKLKALFGCATPDSCTQIGEWTDYACLWNGRKNTMHVRNVIVLWCCSDTTVCPGKVVATDGADCAEVIQYGSWSDTGKACDEGMAMMWVPRGPLPGDLRHPISPEMGRMHHNGRKPH